MVQDTNTNKRQHKTFSWAHDEQDNVDDQDD